MLNRKREIVKPSRYVFVGIGIIIALIGCALAPAKVNREVLCLYSWRTGNPDYAFILFKESDNEKFFHNFNVSASHIPSIAKLEVELTKLPAGTGIVWRDDKTKGLIFPPEGIRNRVIKAAASHGVTLEVTPTFYD